MRYIVLIQGAGEASERLRDTVTAVADMESVVFLRTVEELVRFLKRPQPQPHLLILLVRDRVMLNALMEIEGLLRDMDTILILPDAAAETYALACKLYPRFISLAGGDYNDVGAVLRKMSAGNTRDAPQLKSSRWRLGKDKHKGPSVPSNNSAFQDF